MSGVAGVKAGADLVCTGLAAVCAGVGGVCAGGRRATRTTGAGAGSADCCPGRIEAENPARVTARSVRGSFARGRRPDVGERVKA